jgi:hypothetical protein
LTPGELLEGLKDGFVDIQCGAHAGEYTSDAMMLFHHSKKPVQNSFLLQKMTLS